MLCLNHLNSVIEGNIINIQDIMRQTTLDNLNDLCN
jgi:hypothetical protein